MTDDISSVQKVRCFVADHAVGTCGSPGLKHELTETSLFNEQKDLMGCVFRLNKVGVGYSVKLQNGSSVEPITDTN